MSTCPQCSHAHEADARFCPECGYHIGGADPLDDRAETSGLETVGGLETLDDFDTPGPSGKSRGNVALEPGTRFADRYVIGAVVGRGGMGTVYRAEDSLSEKTVALKLIRTDRLAGSGAVKRLIAEGITARDIRHPNVVAVYDVGEADGQPFIAMEYLEGPSLRSWQRGKLQKREDVPLRIASRIIAETLEGLEAAHAAGVIHRDLKPENIILTGEPGAKTAPLKILDFGIAKAMGTQLESSTGTGLGTPRYMAPEQITAPDTAGPQADLYSISVMFYELLVDVLPQGHWQPPSGGRSDVPQSVDTLIEQGLSNRPASRPESAADYRKALVDAVNIPVNSKKERERESKRGAFDGVLKWIGAGALALMVIALIWPNGDGPCDGFEGQTLQACLADEARIPSGFADTSDDDVEDLREPEQEPVPKQRRRQNRSPYASLSGQWADGLGVVYNVEVDPASGEFLGAGFHPDGYNMEIGGQFNGTGADFIVAAPAINLLQVGDMQFDRGCHIEFRIFDASGSTVVFQGKMHVNHEPDTPCP